MSGLEYNPTPSVVPYFLSDKFVNLIVGPVGSSKTTASLMKLVYEAQRIAPCRDGIRRSRAAIIRNTSQMLDDSTIPDFMKLLGEAGEYMKTGKRIVLRFNDVELEVLFRGLDDPAAARRLLSTQLSFGVIDEFREIHPDIFNALTGRLGRYPDKTMNGVGCCDDAGKQIHKVWAASNPPDMDSWWEKYLSNPPENAAVFFQPSGLSDEADWKKFLPDGYYENLMLGKSEEWIETNVHGRFGTSLSGLPVFRSFDQDYHIAKTPLKPIISTNHPLIIGVDFGLTPACTINQQDARGRFLTYRSLVSEGMGILRFCREKLKPMLNNEFPGHPVIVIGDPAGVQRAQTDERSAFDILKSEGFTAIAAKTNSVTARIAAVENLLSRQIDGEAAWLIDPGATELIRALRGGYRYRAKTNGEMEDKPDKNQHSHIADACQYSVLHIDSVFGATMKTSARREVKRAFAFGWT